MPPTTTAARAYVPVSLPRAAARVAAQAQCSIADADRLLVERSRAECWRVDELAIAVVEGHVHFDRS